MFESLTSSIQFYYIRLLNGIKVIKTESKPHHLIQSVNWGEESAKNEDNKLVNDDNDDETGCTVANAAFIDIGYDLLPTVPIQPLKKYLEVRSTWMSVFTNRQNAQSYHSMFMETQKSLFLPMKRQI